MSIAHNLNTLRAQLAQATPAKADAVHLLAVSKTFPADAVAQAYASGQRAFGENYVQEGVEKILALSHLRPKLQWHLIGPLQSNKTALVARHFDWVQTIDRFKLAQRLNDQRPSDLPPLQVCIQINMDGSTSKSGLHCTDLSDQGLQALWDLAQAITQLPRLRLRGLLSIAQAQADAQTTSALFARARTVYEWLQAKLRTTPGATPTMLDTLSMGMSADYRLAIAQGATMVRIGSALFGARGQRA